VFLLTIWLFLAGYTIAITGKRNLGLSYQPQADGSIKAVDGAGNQAKAYSLMDVISCQDASIGLQGQPPSMAPPVRAAGAPPPQPARIPNLQLGPVPMLKPIVQLPRPLPIPPAPLPLPNPTGILGGLLELEQNVERDVYQGLHGLGGQLRNALRGVRLPQLPTARPLP